MATKNQQMNLWRNFSMTQHEKNFWAIFSGRNKCLKSIKVKLIVG